MQNRQPTLYFVRTLGSNNIAFSRYCSRDGAKQTIESRQSSLYAIKDIRFNKEEDIQFFHLLDKVRELKPVETVGNLTSCLQVYQQRCGDVDAVRGAGRNNRSRVDI